MSSVINLEGGGAIYSTESYQDVSGRWICAIADNAPVIEVLVREDGRTVGTVPTMIAVSKITSVEYR